MTPSVLLGTHLLCRYIPAHGKVFFYGQEIYATTVKPCLKKKSRCLMLANQFKALSCSNVYYIVFLHTVGLHYKIMSMFRLIVLIFFY